MFSILSKIHKIRCSNLSKITRKQGVLFCQKHMETRCFNLSKIQWNMLFQSVKISCFNLPKTHGIKVFKSVKHTRKQSVSICLKNTRKHGVSICQNYNETKCLNLSKIPCFNLSKIKGNKVFQSVKYTKETRFFKSA